MITKYIKNSLARIKKAFIPAHPHFSRSEIVNDEIIIANSWDDVPFDVRPLVPYHSVSDDVKSGKRLEKIGGSATLNGLESARVGKQFLAAFAAAATPAVSDVPAAPAVSDVPAAPVEPSNN